MPILADVERDAHSATITFPYHKDVVETIKHTVPASHRSWEPVAKVWTVRCPYVDAVIAALRTVCDAVDVSRRRSSPGPVPIRTVDGDYAALHLLPSAPPQVIEAAFKALARLHHPDAGGETARMQEINAAAGRLRARLSA